MQLRLPWTVAPRRPREHHVLVGGRPFAIDIRRHPRARRYLLRLSDEGRLRLTVPRGAAIRDGVRFAASQRAWIEAEWRRRQMRLAAWREGTLIWFRGTRVPIRVEGGELRCAGEVLVPSTSPDVRGDVERSLRALATRELGARAGVLAERTGLRPAAVSIRNQRSRWGACSARGRITLNWRLVQMPPAVADYVILHELAHLRQPDHSRRFWREVAALCPDWREAEHWLRRYGGDLL